MKMILNIEPKPQTRPRFSKFGTYEDPKMKAWRRRCSQLIEQEYDGQFFDGPIMVDATFYMKAPLNVSKKPTPKARAKTWDAFKKFMDETLWHAKIPDVDNLVKSLFDSISKAGYNKVDKKGIVWTDDSIVCELRARKKYSPNPRIELEIKELE